MVCRTVQVLRGHASIATTEKYAHLAPGYVADSVSRTLCSDGEQGDKSHLIGRHCAVYYWDQWDQSAVVYPILRLINSHKLLIQVALSL